MDHRHLSSQVIVPTLDYLASVNTKLDSLAARRLLLGTALAESGLNYLRQLSDGPALGLWQMEPQTHDDIWANYLFYRPDLARHIERMTSPWPRGAHAMVGNLWYACAMARVHYFRHPKPMPKASDAEGLATYHEQCYNTLLGAVGKTTDKLEGLDHFRTAIDIIKEDD